MAEYILEKLTVGMFGCNCYIIGTQSTKEVYIIDPGAQFDYIREKIEDLHANPIGIILTHTHRDHTGAVKSLLDCYNIPLFYNKKEEISPLFPEADRWLEEGDSLSVGEIKLHTLETGGHTQGGISLYSKDINSFRGKRYDGIVFTGDLLFRHGIGRTDLADGDREQLCSNISEKIIYNPELSEDILILGGHMGITTIGEEKRLNPFGYLFLTQDDWQKNKYYGKKGRRAN